MRNIVVIVATVIFANLFYGCAEPSFIIHEKLESQLQQDLKSMVAEIMKGSDKQNVLDSPYFVIKDLREFRGDTAQIYSAYAEVDFYYLKNIKVSEKRKFRYDARHHYWDRYFKELHHY